MPVSTFDMTELPINAKIAMLGARSTGKTTLTLDVLRTHSDTTLIVSPPSPRGGFTDFDGFPNVHRKYSPDLLAARRPGGVVILEDCLYEPSRRTDPRIAELMADRETMVIVSMQSSLRVSDKFDVVFVFHESSPACRERLWKFLKHDGYFDSYETFCDVLTECAPVKHDCLVLTDGTRIRSYRSPKMGFGEDGTVRVVHD